MSSTVAETIKKKLQAAFSPSAIVIIDESHLHAGHQHEDGQTFDGKGETHFRVKITAKAFKGMKRVDIHRAINHVLKHELESGIHALAIEAKAE